MQEGEDGLDGEPGQEQEREMEEDDDEDLSGDFADLPIPTRKKGQNIPSWKKHADKKKLRQAVKKRSATKLMKEVE